jgi:hypothetical protein
LECARQSRVLACIPGFATLFLFRDLLLFRI